MRKSGEFKISLSNLKGRKILLNCSESARELMGEERRGEKGAVNIGEGCGTHCMEFVTLAILSQSKAYFDPSQKSEGLRRSFPPLVLDKRISRSPYLLIPLINTKKKRDEILDLPHGFVRLSDTRNGKTK